MSRIFAVLFSLSVSLYHFHGFAHEDIGRGISRADVPKIMRMMDANQDKKYCGKTAKIFDVHLHYHGNVWRSFTPEEVIQLLDKMGVRKALLSSVPNKNSFKLFDLDPSRFYLGVMPYRDMDDYEFDHWIERPKTLDMVEELLNKGDYSYSALGELHLTEKVEMIVVAR